MCLQLASIIFKPFRTHNSEKMGPLLLFVIGTTLVISLLPASVFAAKQRDNMGFNSKKEASEILYFGWFLDETTASSLQSYANEIFLRLYQEPKVRDFMDKVNPGLDPLNYFVKPLDPNTGALDPYYHVTAKFCGDSDCTEYYERVKDSLGKTFEMNLIGFFFTQGTFGVRVQLTPGQEILFDMEEARGITREFPGIIFVPQTFPTKFHPSTSRAHVTLGCAPEVSAVQTGFDLLNIIQYEQEGVRFEEFPVPDLGVLRIFHLDDTTKSAFVLYTDSALLVEGSFEGYDKPTSGNASSISKVQLFTIILVTASIVWRLVW